MSGLGGRDYTAKGRVVRAEPKETRKTHNVSSFSLGFQFATIEEFVEPDNAAELLAEYLSCPKRAAAPELYEALKIFANARVDALTGTIVLGNVGAPEAVKIAKRALAKARGQ